MDSYSRCLFSSTEFQRVTNSQFLNHLFKQRGSVPRIIIIFKVKVCAVHTNVTNDEFIIECPSGGKEKKNSDHEQMIK